MDKRTHLLLGLLTIGAFMGSASSTQAQLTGTNASEFRTIEQSPALNMGVTTAGLGLLGLELWWFMFSKPKTKSEETLFAAPQSAGSQVKESALTLARPKMSAAINLRAFYDGIEMGSGVLIVEELSYPKFSPSFG
ncbi:MAG: hypothetical protein AAF810_00370 [Cyanobacteria bacterium P01_D01_bin.36]